MENDGIRAWRKRLFGSLHCWFNAYGAVIMCSSRTCSDHDSLLDLL